MIRRAALLAIALSLVIGAPAAGAPSWGAATQLSNGDLAEDQALATSSVGDALVAWDQEVGSACPNEPASLSCIHIVEAATRASGGPWATPIEISRPGIGSRPTVALDDSGDAAIAWVHDIGRDRVLQATFRNGRSAAWPEPSDVSEASGWIADHEIALDAAGNVVVVWAEEGPLNEYSVFAAIRSSSSGVWGAPTRLSGPSETDGSSESGPALAITESGRAAVTWVDKDNEVRVVTGDLATGSWGPARTTAGSAGLHKHGARIAVDSAGDIVVAWYADGLWVSVRPHGGDWRPALKLSDVFPDAAPPGVVLDSAQHVTIAWHAPTAVMALSASASSDPSGWGRSVAISRDEPSDPALAVDASGNTVATWAESSTHHIQAAIKPASGKWQLGSTVSEIPNGAQEGAPELQMFARGRAVVVWHPNDYFARATVEAADLSGRGPVIEPLQVPDAALVVGEVHRFSVRVDAWNAQLASEPSWSFGDGRDATGTSVPHRFAKPGRYVVSVAQADTEGNRSFVSADVTVIGLRVRNRRPPTIQGVPRIGRTLTCEHGVWSGSPPIRYAYGWRRDGRLVARAVRRLYRLTPRDVGSLVACDVTATNPAGAVTVSSDLVGIGR